VKTAFVFDDAMKKSVSAPRTMNVGDGLAAAVSIQLISHGSRPGVSATPRTTIEDELAVP
jgi:hypothetical protein